MKRKYNLIKLEKVKSTNFELKKLISYKKKINNLCLSAENQSNGYGRRNKKWHSYRGNIHLSILLKPKCKIDIVNQLSFLASISVGETLNKIKKKINIKYKWPNDILLNKRKVGGILIETSSYINQKIKWIIVGIGLNLQKSPNLKRNEFKATSLKQEKIHIDKNKFIDIFLKTFFINYELWKKKGFNFIKKKWTSNLYTKDRIIIIKYKKNYIKGTLVDLLFNGGIKLRVNNDIKEIFYGDQIT